MKTITKRQLIKDLPERWKAIYTNAYGRWLKPFDPNDNFKIPYEQLISLNLDIASESEIVKIIGDSRWTTIICSECKDSVDEAIEFNKGMICYNCINEAYHLI